METLYGISNWKLTIRRAEDHIEILRGITCDAHAVLPDRLFDLPVTVLGDHALAPTARPIDGEAVRIVSGKEGEWSNRDLQELTFPPCLRAVHNYALYGCRSLHTLHLHDGVDHWGVDCLMNCHRLGTIHLTRVDEGQGEALAYICGAIHEELDVVLHETDGTETHLVFPDYVEDYEENFPNHSFDYHINGGGYAYHHVFPGKKLIFRTYDEHWPHYLRKEHEDETALRLAYTRLRWPAGLEPFAEKQYIEYLTAHAEDALLWQFSRRDATGLRLLLDRLEPDAALLHTACAQARAEGNTEALALLLERQRKAQPRGLDRDFDL